MTQELFATLSLRQQKENLAAALKGAGIPYMFNDEVIMLQYTMHMPEYLEILAAINSIQQRLFSEGRMVPGQINFTRGPVIDLQGVVHEDMEQLIWFYGSDEEFEKFRHRAYPPPMFLGTQK